MTRFPTLKDPASRQELRAVMDDMAATGALVGELPLNFYSALTLRPDLMAAAWDFVKAVLVGGRLSPELKNFVILAISVANQSHYCCLNHAAALRKLQVSEAWIQACMEDPTLAALPVDLRERLLFARKAALDPGSLTSADLLALKRGGLTDEELLELVMVAGLAAWANIWSITADLAPD